MDKKQFKDFIESVAEIKELKPVRDPAIRLDADAYDIVRYEDRWVEVTAQENPTLGFKFVRLKDNHQLCELGCGKIVANQIIEKKSYSFPQPHWRTSCKTCSMTLGPDKQTLLKGGAASQNAFYRWFLQRKE